ncbi:hypothetical protein A3862_16245 [Methylobacterium sp. XJLW]|nr:hypothetical protein A3862_16245 [Methylobacterium sp. XJLW]
MSVSITQHVPSSADPENNLFEAVLEFRRDRQDCIFIICPKAFEQLLRRDQTCLCSVIEGFQSRQPAELEPFLHHRDFLRDDLAVLVVPIVAKCIHDGRFDYIKPM